MYISDTLTKSKVPLETIQPNVVKMYVCGPTVYNYIHIGNARPMVVFDAFRRFLEFYGYKVVMAQNFTDIDDKIINQANEW
ncbi:MAG TPA: cysteine--tRNA ligase, partial [Fervidobacterium sp.]|nr:cysteine--tRNA ligase [Fervidobacterium sp.]